MPLLEVITRCYKRPRLLAENQASLAAQTDGDWAQRLLVDDVGRGVAWANAQLTEVTPVGDYVWMLDDDDLCIYPQLVEDVRAIREREQPDVIIVRMDHGKRGILPDMDHWGSRTLKEGQIGTSAAIVQRDVWVAHRCAWGNRYAGDYDFAASLLGDSSVRIYWHNVIASRVQQIGLGRPE